MTWEVYLPTPKSATSQGEISQPSLGYIIRVILATPEPSVIMKLSPPKLRGGGGNKRKQTSGSRTAEELFR